MENSNPFDLLSTSMCSPLVVFVMIFTLTAICVYLTRNRLKKFNSQKMDNLSDLYSMQEIKFYVFLGITLYGLCKYEQTTLAWVFLMIPLVYVGFKNIFISTFITVAEQNVPHEKVYQQAQKIESVTPQVEQALLQKTVKENQQQQFQQMQQMQQPLNKNINMNMGGGTPVSGLQGNSFSTF